jgi:hypothetical protein
MSRNIIWHELFDRIQNDNCPICELIHTRTIKSMDDILYENVNDVTIRDKIFTSNGLCNYHAYMLMDIGDPLAHAIIYCDLLKRAIYNIETSNQKQKGLYQSHEDCIFCEQAKKMEDCYLSAIIDAFEDYEFTEKYINDGFLCLPHLESIKKNNKYHIDKIVDITLKNIKMLLMIC